MKWVYYLDNRDGRRDSATSHRRVSTNGGTYQQLKSDIVWGYSDPMFIENSIRVPDLLLVLRGYPLISTRLARRPI